MKLFNNKSTRVLLLTMSTLVIISILAASFFYKKENKSVDPRVVAARNNYEKYNVYSQLGQNDSVLILMDSIEAVYNSIPHYKDSYETGVLYNNRAAVYLTLALHSPIFKNRRLLQDSLVNMAEEATQRSITIYESWMNRFNNKNPEEIHYLIAGNFFQGLDKYDQDIKTTFLEKRIKEVQEAQIENPRRLSVSYTNLGIVYRYREQFEDAADCYLKALELWDQNLTAENNLNILLGRPLKKRNLIQKLFPPERK